MEDKSLVKRAGGWLVHGRPRLNVVLGECRAVVF